MGFRPYVYGLAHSLGLKGYAANVSEGVVIEIEGDAVDSFIERLKPEAPPLAKIASVDIEAMPPAGYTDFIIKESATGGISQEAVVPLTLLSPDVATCPDCLSELFDKSDRRYLYPFINCTNCGPRYTITKAVPYDRPNTTMSGFKMCPECEKEYLDTADRRFHAQPNACAECGPRMTLSGDASNTEPVRKAVELLRQGKIVAVKGIGGFHLCCDATNNEAVERLRTRKRKSNKPFALMAADMETVKKYCIVSDKEEALLLSVQRPIVLLKKRIPPLLPDAVAPGGDRLGFMLPYAPLHHVIFEYLHDAPIVATSGNLAEEPIQIDGAEAANKLNDIADAFLDHDRGIFMRLDDSVVKHSGGVRFIRRSRGYVPEPIALSEDGPDVLAVGGDLKNTFTLMKGPSAIVSQHIGDMENYETLKFFEETLDNLKSVYRVTPVALAYDLHPGYMSTKWALNQGSSLQAIACQHHHAHIASVMAEKGLRGPVIGVAFDGTGYGTDGTLWGGEFLIANPIEFKRAAHIKDIPLPGGEAAIKEPWKTAISYIHSSFGEETEDYLKRIGFIDKYGKDNIRNIIKVLGIREASPLSSGAGRLFDAVSAILGICDRNTFEGEAAIAIEGVIDPSISADNDYPLNISYKELMEVDFSFAIIGIINDMLNGVGKGVIAARFHNTVVLAISRVVEKLSANTGISDVVLSGGVFQNDYLLSKTEERLKADGMNVHTNALVPANDGGISLGQAYILRERLKAGRL